MTALHAPGGKTDGASRKTTRTRMLVALPVAAAAAVFAVLGVDGVPARAQAQSVSPRSWAATDYRVPTRDQVVNAGTRVGLVCGLSPGGTAVTSLLMRTANAPTLNPADASALACILGAPAGATCDQLKECFGGEAPIPVMPTCDGDTLRTYILDKAGSKKVAAIAACRAFGASC